MIDNGGEDRNTCPVTSLARNASKWRIASRNNVPLEIRRLSRRVDPKIKAVKAADGLVKSEFIILDEFSNNIIAIRQLSGAVFNRASCAVLTTLFKSSNQIL
ncbi:MAG: hypothetical protein CMK92_05485 [Pseudomonas sp.]|nr:hypothetical protein [Pseudomonas sp.]